MIGAEPSACQRHVGPSVFCSRRGSTNLGFDRRKKNKALDPVLGEAPCPDQRTFSETDGNTLGQVVGTNPEVDIVAMSAALD
eukprot:12406204-Ditylum_brightwellii.AAC.1